MKISNYEEVRDALYHRESFVHGSCHAVRIDDDPAPCGQRREYRVWSYSTLVLVYNLDAGRVVYFDNRLYSQTTSRLQSMIRADFPDATGGHSDRVVYDY
jgi:hypothetical protein